MCDQSNKTSDFEKHRNQKKSRTGWSIEDLAGLLRKERDEMRKNAIEEPHTLASGDMQKIIDGEDDDDE